MGKYKISKAHERFMFQSEEFFWQICTRWQCRKTGISIDHNTSCEMLPLGLLRMQEQMICRRQRIYEMGKA
jgi:hypothetical protein